MSVTERQKSANRVQFLAMAAVIAAMYAVLTYVAGLLNLAYGAVQFRFSEALTVLPVFSGAAVPGLTLGCFLANLGSPLGVVDWVFGTVATLLATLLTRSVRNVRVKGVPVLAPLPPVLCNAVIVGYEISCLSEAGAFSFTNFSFAAFWPSAPFCGYRRTGRVLCAGTSAYVVTGKNGSIPQNFCLTD